VHFCSSSSHTDWTSPLTAPAPTTAPATATGVGVAVTAPPAAEVNVADVDIVDVDVDVVDGHPASVLHMRQQQHQALNQNPRPRLSSSSSTSSAAIKPPASPMAASFDAVLNGGSALPAAAYMSNVLQAAPPPTLPASPMQSTAASRFGAIDNLDDVNPGAVKELSQRLEAKLRDAKSRHLACTEVTLPNDLTQRIAAEIIRMSEREPCGERACTIFIEFESDPNNVR